MPNPYKEAEKLKKKPPAKPQEATGVTEVVDDLVEVKDARDSLLESDTEGPVESPTLVSDILADLIPKKKKPKSETYGFYLDGDVYEELLRLAKANKTNKSKYLNALLRRVLFGE